MALNLLKKYNQLLELNAFSEPERTASLMGVFNRDIARNPHFKFKEKRIHPTPVDGKIEMQTLFTHITTKIVDPDTKKRDFDIHRSRRIHWIKYHIEQRKHDNMLVFSVHEPKGYRTYIYDVDEKYLIVLEPLREVNEYYLLTAYPLRGKDSKRDKIKKKYKRRLDKVL